MIDIAALTETDKGRHVTYRASHGTIEHGRITSWNSRFIFVRYYERIEPDGKHFPRYGETSEATNPDELEF